MNSLEYNQISFEGGLSQRVDSTRLDRTKYPLLVNGRSRFGRISPIKLPAPVASSLPNIANLQGVYGAGNYLLVFGDGKCWVKDLNLANTQFSQIAGFAMSPNAPWIYVELVPASTINFARVPETAGQFNTDIKYTSVIAGSSACVVAQDGVSQPWVIFADGTARVTQTYAQWSNVGNREYVPIGKQMAYQDGILHIMSPDGRQRYRSVTGRPLDFMVSVDAAGDKLLTEAAGGAATVSDSVDFGATTCLGKLNTEDGSIFQGTIQNSYNVIPLIEAAELILGEPNFRHGYLFPAGPQNQFSFEELLGDYAFIDLNGLRSFNAISQYKVEGANSPFSVDLGDLLQDPTTKQSINQDTCCCKSFDNYTFFAVKTKHGYVVLVYDELAQAFVSLDVYPNVEGNIKQFAQVKTLTSRMFFFATTANKVYEMFAGETANCSVYLGDYCSNDASVNQKPEEFMAVFSNAREAGEVSCRTYVDGMEQVNSPLTFPVAQQTEQETIPVALPFGASTTGKILNIPFDIRRAKQGWKVGVYLTWNFEADLTHIYLGASQAEDQKPKSIEFGRTAANLDTVFNTMRTEQRNGNPNTIV